MSIRADLGDISGYRAVHCIRDGRRGDAIEYAVLRCGAVWRGIGLSCVRVFRIVGREVMSCVVAGYANFEIKV